MQFIIKLLAGRIKSKVFSEGFFRCLISARHLRLYPTLIKREFYLSWKRSIKFRHGTLSISLIYFTCQSHLRFNGGVLDVTNINSVY